MRRPVSTSLWLLFTLFVVYGTTMPFNFSAESGWAARKFAAMPWSPLISADTGRRVSIPDFVQNILLFVPFGVLGVLRLRGSRSRAAAIGIVVALGAALSAGIETLQLWTVDRVSATSDVAADVIGALAGAVGAVAMEAAASRVFRRLARTGILALPSFYPTLVAAIVIVIAAWEPFDATLDVSSFAMKARALMRDPWQAGAISDEGIAAIQYALFAWIAAKLATEWRARRHCSEAGSPLPASGRTLAHPPLAVNVGRAAASRPAADYPPLNNALVVIAAVGVAAAFGLEACQIVIASRMPSLEDATVRAAGVLIGLTLWRAFRPETRPLFWFAVLVVATTAGAALWMFSPFEVAPAYHSFGWFPFFGYYQHTTFETVSHVIELLLIYFPVGFAACLVTKRASSAMLLALIATLAVAVPVEYGQGWFVGRYPDLTDVLVSVAGGALGMLAARHIRGST